MIFSSKPRIFCFLEMVEKLTILITCQKEIKYLKQTTMTTLATYYLVTVLSKTRNGNTAAPAIEWL